MKLENIQKKKPISKNGKRKLTSVDMSSVKHLQAINNSEVKRGEAPKGNTHNVLICECGVEGCGACYRT